MAQHRPIVLRNGRLTELPVGDTVAGAGPPGGGDVVQMRFAVTAAQADFVLPSNPVNGICLVSLNGVLQHEYVCLESTVSIDPPAEAGDDVMINAQMAAWLAGPPGGGDAVQMRFAVTAAQADFVLPSNPANGVCLVSLNGVLQHEYVCLESTVSIDPPAEAGDDVMITWWGYA